MELNAMINVRVSPFFIRFANRLTFKGGANVAGAGGSRHRSNFKCRPPYCVFGIWREDGAREKIRNSSSGNGKGIIPVRRQLHSFISKMFYIV
jgi:hypothetical protein